MRRAPSSGSEKTPHHRIATGLRAELDARAEPLSARVRGAELERVPFVLVIGHREPDQGMVSLPGGAESESLLLFEWMAAAASTPSRP